MLDLLAETNQAAEGHHKRKPSEKHFSRANRGCLPPGSLHCEGEAHRCCARLHRDGLATDTVRQSFSQALKLKRTQRITSSSGNAEVVCCGLSSLHRHTLSAAQDRLEEQGSLRSSKDGCV